MEIQIIHHQPVPEQCLKANLKLYLVSVNIDWVKKKSSIKFFSLRATELKMAGLVKSLKLGPELLSTYTVMRELGRSLLVSRIHHFTLRSLNQLNITAQCGDYKPWFSV